MRKVVSHLIMTLDGVVKFDAVADTIVKLRDTKEVWDGTRGQDLGTLISRQDPVQPFVHLHGAMLINNRGQIVARGVDSRRTDGRTGWYLLTPVTEQ